MIVINECVIFSRTECMGVWVVCGWWEGVWVDGGCVGGGRGVGVFLGGFLYERPILYHEIESQTILQDTSPVSQGSV